MPTRPSSAPAARTSFTARARRAVAGLAVAVPAVMAQAQPAPLHPPPPRPIADPAAPTASGNDAAFEGRVAAYLLSPDAGVAGLIFDDGRQVSVAPHLGGQLAALVRPGQQVRVGPRRDDAFGPGGARRITSIATGATLAEGPPDDPGPSPVAAGDATTALQPTQATGTVRLLLRGPRGETNGMLLDTGTQVFFPPHVANEAADWLRPGNSVQVEGYGRSSGVGTVLQATRIAGPQGQTAIVFGSAAGRQERR